MANDPKEARDGSTARRRQLRRSPSDAESLLWYHLRGRQSAGWKFRRQHQIGPYFVDFCCVQAALVIEVDGSQHYTEGGAASDARRTVLLESKGYRVLRFTNVEVLTNIEGVMAVVLAALEVDRPDGATPSPSPSPSRERELAECAATDAPTNLPQKKLLTLPGRGDFKAAVEFEKGRARR